MTPPGTAAPSARAERIATWALSIAQLVSWGTIYYAFSLFVVPMEQQLGWARTDTNAAVSFGLLVSGAAAYPIGAWIDRGHGRTVMAGGSALATAMLLLWANAHALATLFVVWAGLGVAIAATLYDPLFAIVTRAHPRTFRTRITLITLVGGFASTVFIPLTQVLIDAWGWRAALLALAAANLCVCLPVHWRMLRPPGADTVPLPRRDAPAGVATSRATTRRALSTPTFWGLALCFTTYYITFAALTFHLVPLMTERRVGNGVILMTMALIGPAQVLARAALFAVSKRLNPTALGMIIVTLFPASVLILLAAGTSAPLLYLFALCYGAANGMMTILRGTVVQDLMWTEGFGTISGLLSLPSNIAKGLAPISAAALWSIWHRYLEVEWIILAVSLLAAAAFLYAARASRRLSAHSQAAQ